MPVCPNCGATVPDGAIACGRCGAPLNQPQTSSMSQSPASSGTTTWGGSSSELQMRFQKAFKRNQQLSYVLVILAVVLLVILLI